MSTKKTHTLMKLLQEKMKTNFNTWLLRFEHILLLSFIFIFVAKIITMFVLNDFTLLISVINKLNEYKLYLVYNLNNTSDFSKVNLIIVSSLLLFILMIFKFKRELFNIKNFKILIILSLTLITIGFFFKETILSFYLRNYKYFGLFVGIVLLLIGNFFFTTKRGRTIMLTFIKFLLELTAFIFVIYNLVTLNYNYLINLGVIFWLELKRSILFLTPVMDKLGVTYVIITVIIINTMTILSIIFTNKERKREKLRGFIDNVRLPNISINIPAYNEREVIIPTVLEALKSNYPKEKLNILVIADGSKDGTPDVVIKYFNMYKIPERYSVPYISDKLLPTRTVHSIWRSHNYPNLRLIIKENGGKHDALNVGIKYAVKQATHLLNLDADTKLERNALRLLAERITRDKYINAVAGMVVPHVDKNKKTKLLSRLLVDWQQLDYLTAFHSSRSSLSLFNSIMIISGAFGLFDRYLLLTLNGYTKGLGEDMHLTLKIQQAQTRWKFGRIDFVPKAIAYTAAPQKLEELKRQRIRWFKGLLESISAFKRLMFSRKLLLGSLHFILVEILNPLLVPIGVLNIIMRPEMLTNAIFIASIISLVISFIISTIVATIVENKYRKINVIKLLTRIPFQIIMMPLTFIWRNDAFLQLNNKNWGDIKKQF